MSAHRLAQLDYSAERARVVDYWRGVTAQGIPSRFPRSGSTLSPKGSSAASASRRPRTPTRAIHGARGQLQLQGLRHEAAFQSQLLDVTGYHDLSRMYLDTWPAVQGSKPFRGTYTDQAAVYHGAKTGEDYGLHRQ